jgi:hypothetical protein
MVGGPEQDVKRLNIGAFARPGQDIKRSTIGASARPKGHYTLQD